MGPSGRGGNEVVGGWVDGGGGGAGRPSPTLCESKQRVRQRGEKEFGDHDRAADPLLPAGPPFVEKEGFI